MRFYSRITGKPNSVVIQVKNGKRIVSQKRIATFIDGIFDTDDPEVIEKLSEHPDKFRTGEPFPKAADWKDTPEGKVLMEQGRQLGLDLKLKDSYKNISKTYLEKLIRENPVKVQETRVEVKFKTEPAKGTDYQEIVNKAKELGIKTHQRKKEDILTEIKQKEVMSK